MKAALALAVPVSVSALLLAGCGGDSGDSGSSSPAASTTASESKPATASASASPSEGGPTAGGVGDTLTTESGVAVTLDALELPAAGYEVLGEERPDGTDPIQGYRAVLNATVVNNSPGPVTLTETDVALDFFTTADVNGQGGGEQIACEQVFLVATPPALRAPGEVAAGGDAAWTPTFVCPGQRLGTPVEAVYTVDGEQLTFTGELP